MSELSIFVDESGDVGTGSKYYLLTLVFHNQTEEIASFVDRYEQSLKDASLPKMTFHFGPLTHGQQPYDVFDSQQRKYFLSRFQVLAERLPYSYITLSYEKRQFENRHDLESRMRHDVYSILIERLGQLQQYDLVKVYYDNGQIIVHNAIHSAIEQALSKNVVVYRDIQPADYYLFQIADFICGIELTHLRYTNHEHGSTERIMFGDYGSFKKNVLKKVRKHLL